MISLTLINFAATSFLNQAPGPGVLFLLLIFPVLKQNKPAPTTNLNSNNYSEIIATAEELRKDKQVNQAEQTYWQAIKAGEASSDWQTKGPQSKPYKKLAKLYYHTERDEQALEVIDRYLKLAQKFDINTETMEELKQRLAQGDFRRLVNKYS